MKFLSDQNIREFLAPWPSMDSTEASFGSGFSTVADQNIRALYRQPAPLDVSRTLISQWTIPGDVRIGGSAIVQKTPSITVGSE
jgi:hypothetical protein